MAVDLDPALLDVLACPNCHAPLAVDHDRHELVCTGNGCGLAYPVRDGIPVLLVDEARNPHGVDTGRGRPTVGGTPGADTDEAGVGQAGTGADGAAADAGRGE